MWKISCVENIFWICNIWTIFKLDIFSKTGVWAHGRPCMLLSFYIPFSSTGDKTRWRNSQGDFGSSCNPQEGLKDWVAKYWIVFLFLLWQTRRSKSVSYCLMQHYFKTGGNKRWHFPLTGRTVTLKCEPSERGSSVSDVSCFDAISAAKKGNAGSWHLRVWSPRYMKGSVLRTVHSFQLPTEFDLSSNIFHLTVSFYLLLE